MEHAQLAVIAARDALGAQIPMLSGLAGIAVVLVVPVLALLWIGSSLMSVCRKEKRPPTFSGWVLPALLGRYRMQKTGPNGLLAAAYKQCGEIFTLRVFHRRITMFIGSEANTAFFSAKDAQLAQAPIYKFTVPVFGPGVVYDSPTWKLNQQMKFLKHGLSGAGMRGHCAKIVKETIDFFASWPDEGEINLHDTMSELTIMTASRCLLGDEIRESMHAKVADLYQQVSDGMNHISFFFPYFPTTKHRVRDQARTKIVEIFKSVVSARRANTTGEKKEDFLQVLIDARYKDGSICSDDDICGLLLAALFAGQHTSTITSTWTGLELLRNKHLIPRLLEEQKKTLSETEGELTFDSLSNMNLLHNCVKETLRMYPPLILLMRAVLEPIEYKGYTVPKGDIVMVSPPLTHNLPELYKDPAKYDPDRYDRGEGNAPFSYIAFGGGRHSCLGQYFGQLQVKSIWSVLLRQFEFEAVGPHPETDYGHIVAGPMNKDARVRYKRKKFQL